MATLTQKTNEIAALEALKKDLTNWETKLSKATKEGVKSKIQDKIKGIKEQIKAGRTTEKDVSAKQLANALLRSRKKFIEMSKKDFTGVITKLSKKPEYGFLKGMTRNEVIDDINRKAKPVGWRFKGRKNYKTPTKEQVRKGRKDGSVYYENRPNRSDVSQARQLEKGGSTYAEGGVIYKHKYIPTMTFEITGETEKGYKGIQKDKKSLSRLERTKGKSASYSSSELKDLFNKETFAQGGSTYQGGGEIIEGFNPKDFSLEEIDSKLTSKDILLQWVRKGDSTYSADKRGFVWGGDKWDSKYWKQIKDKRFTMSDYGQIAMDKGSENLYFTVIIYEVDGSDEPMELQMYSKDNHKDLKSFANSFVSKMAKGGSTYAKGGGVKGMKWNDIYEIYPSDKYYMARTQLQDWTDVVLTIKEKTGEKTSSGRDIYKDELVKIYKQGSDDLWYEQNDKGVSTYAKGGEVRTMGLSDSVIYKDKTWYITEKNGKVGLTNFAQGAHGSDYPFVPITKIIQDDELTDMYGNKVFIPYSFEKGGEIKVGDKVIAKGKPQKVYEVTAKFKKEDGKTAYNVSDNGKFNGFISEDYIEKISGSTYEKGGEIERGEMVFVTSENDLIAEVIRMEDPNDVLVEFIGERPSGGDKRGSYKLSELKYAEYDWDNDKYVKMAKGGSLKGHGLAIGDEIVNVYRDDVYVYNRGVVYMVDLSSGKRTMSKMSKDDAISTFEKGGNTEDETPVIRYYFEDDAYEYGKGGKIAQIDEILSRTDDSNKYRKLTNIRKKLLHKIRLNNADVKYLETNGIDTYSFESGGEIDINDIDIPVHYTMFEDEMYEYGKGGIISVGDEVIVRETGKTMEVSNISKNRRGQVEFTGSQGTFLIGDLKKN